MSACSKAPSEKVLEPSTPSSHQVVAHLEPSPSRAAQHQQAIERWAYQLQNIDMKELMERQLDLLVLEPFPDGESEPGISTSDLNALQEHGTVVMAYLSIGEAEDYRDYWNTSWVHNAPIWLEDENPRWPGNFRVQYWNDDWQALIEKSLQQKIEAGFDGVYLDLVDAYEYFESQNRPRAREEMVDFVLKLAQKARKRKPDFKIYAQNAEELTLDAGYLAALDGLGREELHFGYEGRDNVATPDHIAQQMKTHLTRAKEAGKVVLTIEYTDQPEQIKSTLDVSVETGFLPYFAPRDLDFLPE